jgi:hypothetical protein
MTKKVTFIYCPGHPRASTADGLLGDVRIPAGMVKADDHGECSQHGSVSKPRAGTKAYEDSRGLWLPDGEFRPNTQIEHPTGQLDAIVRPDTIRVTYNDLKEHNLI